MEKKDMIFGTRAVMETIRAGKPIEKIFIQSGLANDLIKELVTEAKQHAVPYTFVPVQKLERFSYKNHQGVVCQLAAVTFTPLQSLIDHAYHEGREPFFIMLDRITDVRNFGAIARSAECAGLDGIIIGEKGNAPITGDAMKTSAGALSHIPVCRERDLKKTLQQLKENGMTIVACTEKSKLPIYQADLNKPVVLLIGSEEDGVSPDFLKEADLLVAIPQHGKISSLNASVAAGIAIFETIRQKAYK
jgi:23S rRNA (guanosine2251-2'-O)-methyltransferase